MFTNESAIGTLNCCPCTEVRITRHPNTNAVNKIRSHPNPWDNRSPVMRGSNLSARTGSGNLLLKKQKAPFPQQCCLGVYLWSGVSKFQRIGKFRLQYVSHLLKPPCISPNIATSSALPHRQGSTRFKVCPAIDYLDEISLINRQNDNG